jgi:hypothetical protein
MRTITSPSDALSPKCTGGSLQPAQASAAAKAIAADW